MLALEGVTKDFGGLRAVDEVSFVVAPGTITGLIGPNGAGKTTLFSLIAGALAPTAGRIAIEGRRIDRLPAHRVFRNGIVRTFQIPRPFASMTVLENLMLVPLAQSGETFWNTWFARRRIAAEERRNRERARDILDFLNLRAHADEEARTLSGGQLKLLELARALMSDPRLILLDEPGAGVNPTLLNHIVDRIAALRARGTTFLVIEHNMDVIERLCRPVIVMAQGRVLTQGSAEEVRRDPRVLEAYLGGAG
jgi:branched-chain amino acid transport system ATP-binding protein